MQFESSSAGKAIAGLRIVGYGILVLCVFDLVDLLYPFQVFNSDWEFNTVGNLVERVGFPLVGFGLIFLGEETSRHKVERFALKPLSWALLIYAIVYLLLVPLTVSSGWRIYNQNNAKLVNQLAQQRDRTKAAQEQLGKLSDEQVKALVQRSTIGSVENFNVPQFRKQQLEGVEAQAQQVEAQLKATVAQQTQNLVKKGTKWALGAAVAGVAFLYLWSLSSWAREKKIKARPLAMSR
ncbi:MULTISPECIES: HpsJ-like protein, cyanoexosortase A-associated [Leptolyngbya]|uniref:HpsJ-like protein, cyanoexosortase A-associated n=1 Tax=Leptolyngbya TaxID=47251 RepID=UPI001685B06C|nr:HpsJ family protein [Leptolyngbya sp. FACHB-1624]MBD1858304.1 hypothetical protein [Leptolyngbya sp. FACHB-1624]